MGNILRRNHVYAVLFCALGKRGLSKKILLASSPSICWQRRPSQCFELTAAALDSVATNSRILRIHSYHQFSGYYCLLVHRRTLHGKKIILFSSDTANFVFTSKCVPFTHSSLRLSNIWVVAQQHCSNDKEDLAVLANRFDLHVDANLRFKVSSSKLCSLLLNGLLKPPIVGRNLGFCLSCTLSSSQLLLGIGNQATSHSNSRCKKLKI
jgi:hypothetical protein